MLIHASEAETLNSIRFALEREEQQIRVNDGTGEIYDITISRSAPYASPVVSRTATPSNVSEPAHTSTTSGGHRILRLPQLVSKRTQAPNGNVPRPSTDEKSLPVVLESSQSSTDAGSDAQQTSSSSSYTAPTRHHPFLSELPPSPPLEADYVAGHDSRNGLMNSIYNGSAASEPVPNGNAPQTSPKAPVARRAYTADLSRSIPSPDGHIASPDRFTAEPNEMEDLSSSAKFSHQQSRYGSTASTASNAYRTASSQGGSESDTDQAGASSSRAADASESRGVSEPPAIRLTHDTSPYSHKDSSVEAGSMHVVSGRQTMPRRNTTGSSLQGRRGSNGMAQSRRSSRDRDPAFSSGSGQGPTDMLNSPTTDMQNLAFRTGDAAFDEEAAKHADQLRRDRRYKEQKARDAAAEEEQADAEPASMGGTLTRSKTLRDWRLREKEREEEMEPKVLVGNLVGEGHANYALMYNMLTGIRIGVSRCQAKTKRTLCDADFTAKHKIAFDIIGNELTPTAKYDFKFKDYAPWVFRELREYFYLDAADYLLSLTSKYILSELGSPGKSGSFFYFSRDYRFIIKTIRHEEHKFLLRILKDYHEHVKANPHTLLSRFYGLHRVKLPHGRKIHFVIMNNLFPPHRDIHETYDLKGSSVGREYPEEKAAAKKGAVLKDLNWLNRGREIELGPEKRALFEAQLKSDVALLQRLNIMDYSLLIGLHDMRRGNKENLRRDNLRVFQPETKDIKRQPTQINRGGAGASSEKDASALRQAVRRSDPKALNAQQVTKLPDRDVSERRHFLFYQDEGGFRSTDEANQPGHMIYYLGVIDLFTPYTYVKRGETFWKGLRQNRHMISSVPPKEYGQRFFDFLCSVVTGGDKSRMPKMFGFPPKTKPAQPPPKQPQ